MRVPNGLIHDWIGAAFIPGATVEQTLALVQDYDNHKNIYKPEVMDSRLISHHGDDYTIFLRLLKKKIITVVLDTYHDVHYQRVRDDQWFCRSYTTRIAEVDDAGTAKEKIYPPDTGYGFLWRLYSYWRFMEEGRRRHRRVPRHFVDAAMCRLVWDGSSSPSSRAFRASRWSIR